MSSNIRGNKNPTVPARVQFKQYDWLEVSEFVWTLQCLTKYITDEENDSY